MVATAAGPRPQVDRQVAVVAPDLEAVTGRHPGQSPVDQQVGPPVEAEVVKVDSRQR